MEFPSRGEINIKEKERIEELKRRGLLMDDKKTTYVDSDGDEVSIGFEVIEESKIYSWSRVYSSEDQDGLDPGDIITITYVPTGETLDLEFATYNKTGLVKDSDGVIDYNPEDDKKVLCLLVDIGEINDNNTIPFLRTLFKSGKWYQHQVLRRNDLIFTCVSKKMNIDYYSVDF